MTPQPRSRDISGKLVFLGTGTSVGVPVIGCGCDVCRSENPKNHRLRCGLALGLPGGNLLVDTTPDLRAQLLRANLGVANAVLYTHEHADHVFGLDDLRLMPFYIGGPVPLYCEPTVEDRIRKSFDYAFADRDITHPGARPQLEFQRIGLEPFTLLGQEITPIRLQHGPHFDVLGFRFGNVAYCTDTNGIPAESWPKLAGLDVLVLGALRERPHPTHFSLEEAVEAAQQAGAKRTYLTHLGHELDHERTNAWLPEGIEVAYDGLEIPLT